MFRCVSDYYDPEGGIYSTIEEFLAICRDCFGEAPELAETSPGEWTTQHKDPLSFSSQTITVLEVVPVAHLEVRGKTTNLREGKIAGQGKILAFSGWVGKKENRSIDLHLEWARDAAKKRGYVLVDAEEKK